MQDLISRRETIDEIMKELKDRSLHDDEETSEDFADGYDEGIRNAATRVYLMPSAQPERISDPDRVYDELSKVYNMKDLSDEVYSIIGDLMLSLHEPERKKGKWIEYDNSHCECPFCHEEWSYFDNEVEYFNLCPKCGEDLRGDDHDL